jgi:hypothetical protein
MSSSEGNEDDIVVFPPTASASITSSNTDQHVLFSPGPRSHHPVQQQEELMGPILRRKKVVSM